MNLKYTFILNVLPDEAWKVLMDILLITPCMPGASLDGEDEGGYKGSIKVKLGPIDMVYKGTIKFLERHDAEHRAVLEAAASEVKGAGNAKAVIQFYAQPVQGGTEVTVDSDFSVSGKAAQFGGGVMQSVGKRLMDEFAKRVVALIASQSVPPVSDEAPGNQMQAAAVDQAGSRIRAESAGQHSETEALNLVGLAWKPVLIRVLVAAGVIAAVAFGVSRILV